MVDRTGLTETYAFRLWFPKPDAPDIPLPSVFTGLREKFGLELKPFTGPIDVLIVDHVEKPSAD